MTARLVEQGIFDLSGAGGTTQRRPRGRRPPGVADKALPRWHQITVIAQDPSVHDPTPPDEQHKILRASMRAPADRLWPGPRTHRFHVVDYDASAGGSSHVEDFVVSNQRDSGRYRWLFHDTFKQASDDELMTSRRFFAQNVYAIAARTLANFEFALGRRVPWGFYSHQLYLVPHAFEMPNAFYSRENHAIFFGYLKDPRLETCLSHDIVAHETAHAVLDGLRRRYLYPGYPDQAAFHEALADVVALLSVFSTQEVVEKCLRLRSRSGRVSSRITTEDLRRTVLFKLAEEFGRATHDDHRDGLRESVRLLPFKSGRRSRAYREPHKRGQVIVAAIMQTLLRMWRERIGKLGRQPSLSLVAEEGSKSAEHLLNMVIRSIDYCPPVEFEFEDLLDAILVADAEVAPDDEHNYRRNLRDAFDSFGIRQPKHKIIPLWRNRPVYNNINFGEFVSRPDEVHQFVWQNAEALGLRRDFYTRIEDVQPCVRIGPDGLVARETAACYVQAVEGSVADLVRLSQGQLQKPIDCPDDMEITLYGGGVLIFDQFGQPKYHQSKPLDDWDRQTRRLQRLIELGDERAGGVIGLHGMVVGRRKADW